MIYAHILPRSKANKLTHMKKSHSEYIEALNNIGATIEPLENYVGDKTKIKHICKKCSNVWGVTPSNAKKGRGCPECKRNNLRLLKTMSEDEYIAKLKIKNPDYSLVGKYTTQKTKTLHRCLKCGNEWEVSPDNILSRAVTCPNCRKERIKKRMTLSQDEFLSRFKANGNPNIIYVGKYTGMHNKVSYRCANGHKGRMPADTLVRGCDCKKCMDETSREKHLLSNEEFVSRINKIHPNIKLLSEYKGAKESILFQVNGEERVRRTNAGALFVDSRWDHTFKGEICIEAVLQKYHIKFEREKRYSDLRGKRNPLSYDFYLPDYKMLIEYQGEQHQRAVDIFGGTEHFKIQQKYDELKKNYASSHGLELLEIWYYDYDNIEEIIIKKLKLGTVETAG